MAKFSELSLYRVLINLLVCRSLLFAHCLAISREPTVWKQRPLLRKFCRQQVRRWPSLQQLQLARDPTVTFYHLHIPKAAGLSFAQDINHILSSSETPFNVDSHEGCYGDSPHAHAGVVTMLRNPRSHVLSQYSFCKTSADRGPQQIKDLMPPTLDSWVSHWKSMQSTGEAFRDFSGAASEHNPPWCSSTPFGCYNPTDLQSHRLTCQSAYKYNGTIDGAAAVEKMQAAYFVGIVEAYHESLCLFHAKVHSGKIPEWCDCKNAAHWSQTDWSHSIAHGSTHLNENNVEREILADVDAFTANDWVLYGAAVQRFLKEVRQVEENNGVSILCEPTLTTLRLARLSNVATH